MWKPFACVALCTATLLGQSAPSRPASQPASQLTSQPTTRPATGVVTGVVLDALGDPLPQAEVWVSGLSDPRTPLARGRTDGSGAFMLPGVPRDGGSLRVSATAPGRIRTQTWTSLRTDRPDTAMELRLWDAGTIRARVLAPGGKPLAGAWVCAAYDHARIFGFDPAAEAQSDAEGRARLEDVPLGWIRVRAWAPGHQLVTRDLWLRDESEVAFELPAGEQAEMQVVVTGLPDGLTGSVSVLPYAQGSHQVVPSVLVRGSTDATGTWRATGLPDFEYVVSVSCAGFHLAPREVRLKPGAAERRAEFTAVADGALVVTGTLRDVEGHPLAGETLVCRHYSGGKEARAVTGPDGAFRLSCPLAAGSQAILHLTGSNHVLVQAKEGGLIGARDARFRGYHEFVVKDSIELALRAQAAASVSGLVVTAEGRPVAGRRVQLQEENPSRTPRWMSMSSATTDHKGRFSFRGLHAPPGDLRVSIGDQGADATEAFQLPAGKQIADLRLVTRGFGTVEGMARGADGKPIAGARVWLRDWDTATGRQASGAVAEVLTDRNGRFRHIRVEPGGHYLQLLLEEARGGGPIGEPFEVEAGKAVVRDLQR